MANAVHASKAPASRSVMVRLPSTLLAAVDDHLARMRARMPSITITRSDAIRELLAAAIDAKPTKGGRA